MPDLIRYCRSYNGLLPCSNPPYLIKRVSTYLLTHDSVIDHSDADVLHNYIINEETTRTATDLTNSNIFKQEYIM